MPETYTVTPGAHAEEWADRLRALYATGRIDMTWEHGRHRFVYTVDATKRRTVFVDVDTGSGLPLDDIVRSYVYAPERGVYCHRAKRLLSDNPDAFLTP